MRFQARLLVQLSSVFDALVIAVLFATIWDFRSGQSLPNSMVALLIVPFWLTLLRFFGVYESQRLGGWVALARKVASAHFVGFTALALVAAVSGNGLYGRLFLFTGASAAFLTLEKTLTHVVLRLMRRRGFDARNVLVIGNRATAAEVDRSFKAHMAWGLRVAMLGVGPASARTFETFPEGVPAGGSLEEVLNAHVIDEVIISARPDDFVHEQITIHLCERSGVVAMGRCCQTVGEIVGHAGREFAIAGVG